MQESPSGLAMALPMVNWHTLNSWVLGQSRLTLFSCRWLLLAVVRMHGKDDKHSKRRSRPRKKSGDD
jgi:hypothetical protein